GELVELYLRSVERRQVAAQSSLPAGLAVGLQRDYGSPHGRVGGHNQVAIDVERVDEVAFEGLAGLHWIIARDLHLETRSRRQHRLCGRRGRRFGLRWRL